MPALRVWVEAGQPTHAPVSSTSTIPVPSSTACRMMSPPVGLQCRADHFDGGFDLCSHLVDHSISGGRTIHAVTVSFAALLAHQGGWDEALLIGGPIVAIAGLLMLAKRRVEAAAGEFADASSTDTD